MENKTILESSRRILSSLWHLARDPAAIPLELVLAFIVAPPIASAFADRDEINRSAMMVGARILAGLEQLPSNPWVQLSFVVYAVYLFFWAARRRDNTIREVETRETAARAAALAATEKATSEALAGSLTLTNLIATRFVLQHKSERIRLFLYDARLALTRYEGQLGRYREQEISNQPDTGLGPEMRRLSHEVLAPLGKAAAFGYEPIDATQLAYPTVVDAEFVDGKGLSSMGRSFRPADNVEFLSAQDANLAILKGEVDRLRALAEADDGESEIVYREIVREVERIKGERLERPI